MSPYVINDPRILETLCQRVYFPMEPVSVGQVTGMHGIIYYILREYVSLSDPICNQYDIKAHMATCERRLRAGLGSVDILSVPSFDNILSLILGVCSWSKMQLNENSSMICGLYAYSLLPYR
jgi:hypothetical protein